MAKSEGLAARITALIEEYGFIAFGVLISLTVIEIVVIMALLRAGVDLQPLVDLIERWFGLDASGAMETAGYFGIAYALTRFLKPFQFAATLVLTPIVARVIRGSDEDGDTGS